MPGGRKSAYRERTVAVKALPANGWGLYQMHGNVWEWCADRQRTYGEGEAIDPMGEAPSSGPASRVLRGGSWVGVARFCRSALRGASSSGGIMPRRARPAMPSWSSALPLGSTTCRPI